MKTMVMVMGCALPRDLTSDLAKCCLMEMASAAPEVCNKQDRVAREHHWPHYDECNLIYLSVSAEGYNGQALARGDARTFGQRSSTT